MSKGPSKFLYGAGGWFLGGVAGGLVGMALVAGAFAIGASTPAIAGCILAAEIISFGSSVVGGVMGWNKAARDQESYAMEHGQSVQSIRAPSVSQDLSPELNTSFADKVGSKTREGSYVEYIANEKLAAASAHAAR
jgi:hypothetical protein